MSETFPRQDVGQTGGIFSVFNIKHDHRLSISTRCLNITSYDLFNMEAR